MSKISAHIGLDVHKNSISIAAAPAEAGAVAQFHKRIPNDVTRLLKELQLFGPATSVHVCYEAGPTGYRLARRLLAEGYRCEVVAPAKTPKMASDRVKTDKRDALKLAKFLRSGHLTAIRIPTPEEEALRDLIRTREDLKRDEIDLRRRLGALMLRHERIWTRKSNWTKAHFAWLEVQQFEHIATNEAKHCYLEQIKHLRRVIAELDASISEAAMETRQANLIRALCALKGVKTLIAATFIAEIGDFRRFATAAQFMSFLGLTPSESSSGDSFQRGPITKAGNRRLRRLLVEAAWTYIHAPHESVDLKRRSQGVHQDVKDIAMKAQKRLWKRRRKLANAQKSPRKINVAMARELAGFIWAIAQQDQLLEEAA